MYESNFLIDLFYKGFSDQEKKVSISMRREVVFVNVTVSHSKFEVTGSATLHFHQKSVALTTCPIRIERVLYQAYPLVVLNQMYFRL